jgi:UDP-N-acetyl-D-mannosaminuronic acid dehydrogenase
MKISVLGLGYIGLPTSLLLANAGYDVIGIDVNSKIIEKLNNGALPFEEPGLDDLFEKTKNKFKVSNKLETSDVYIIAVPTPLDKNLKIANLSYVKEAADTISKVLKPGQLVILESTVPPGTSDNIVIPTLRMICPSGFYYSHCPERAIPGKTIHEMITNDRIIGAINNEGYNKTKDIYSTFVKGNIYESDVKTSEFIKLMENTFRDINIALANEFSLIAEELGINIWDAIKLANHHPRVNILKPGPGVGGHCLAIDPLFLVGKSDHSRIIKLAREINDFMSFHVVKLAINMTKEIHRPVISILGLSYKGNVDDTRESPSLKIVKVFESEGIQVKIHDPFVNNYEGNESDVNSAVKDSDCIILVTDHEVFKEINPFSLQVRSKNLIDTRNILDHKLWKDAGYNIKILGNGI